MNEREFELLFSLIMENMSIVSDKKVKNQMKKATDIMKDIGIKDSPILACALTVTNDGIWTEDKHFDKQKNVKIWKTKELKKYM